MSPVERLIAIGLSLILVITLGLAIAVPLLGTLVRLRANFDPKGVQLDPEDGVQPHTTPVITGYFAMMHRVKQLEGWAGLYKGLMPTSLQFAFFALFQAIAYGIGLVLAQTWVAHSTPAMVAIEMLLEGIFLFFISFPVLVIKFRAITTQHHLPYLAPTHSLHVLLTPTERRRPWVLYFNPGLLAAWALQILYVSGLRTLRRMLLPRMTSPEDVFWVLYTEWLRVIIFFGTIIASITVICPLEVATTRLALQRNHAALEYNRVAQEAEGEAEETIEYEGIQQDVIGLRSHMDPYLGLADAVQTIVREEGWAALYRGWFITLLFRVFQVSIFVFP